MLKSYLNSSSSYSKFIFSVLLLLASGLSLAQNNSVAIGSETVNNKAVLMLVSPDNNQGLMIPVVSDRNVIGATASEEGMIVYDSSDKKIYYWNATEWVELGAGSGGGSSDSYELQLTTNILQLLKNGNPEGAPVDLALSGDITGSLGSTQIAAEAVGLNELKDMGAITDQYLVFNGSAWEVRDIPTGAGTDSQDLGFSLGIISLSGDPDNTQIDLSNYDDDNTDDLTNASSVNELADVNITSPSNTQILQYQSGQWVNVPLPAGAGDLLSTNNLSDVANAGTARTNLGLGTIATQDGTVSTDGTLIGNSDANIPTEQAVKTYVDTEIGAIPAGGDLVSTNNLSDVANAGTARTNLGLGTIATQAGTVSTDGTLIGNSDANIPTEQAVKTYVDTEIGAIPAGGDLVSTNNLSDVANAGTARTNLGLGTIATQDGTVSTDGTLIGNSDANIPTEQAVKTYIDTQTGVNATAITANNTIINTKQDDVMTTDGDIVYYNGAANRLPVGANGQVLTLASGLPAWQTPDLQGAYDGGNNISLTTAGDLNIFDDGGFFSILKLDEATRSLAVNQNFFAPNTSLAISAPNTGGDAIYARSESNVGTTNLGINATAGAASSTNTGVFGLGYDGSIAYGVRGNAFGGSSANIGVYGLVNGSSVGASSNQTGVQGWVSVNAAHDVSYGLYGYAGSSGANANYGIYASASNATTNFAGWFNGNVVIDGELQVGNAPQVGVDGQVLTSSGPGSAPTWSTPDGGSLQSAYDGGGENITLTDGTTPIGITATSGSGDFESLMTFDVSDAAGGLSITNGTSTNIQFVPSFSATTTGVNPWTFRRNALDAPGLYFEFQASDNGGSANDFASIVSMSNNGDTRFNFSAAGQASIYPTSPTAISIRPYDNDNTGVGTSRLEFRELIANGTNIVSLQAPDAMTNDVILTLPSDNSSGVLTNDGAGTLSWGSAGGSGWSFGGNSGLTDGAVGVGTNFIGTTNLVPLKFVYNSQFSGIVDGSNTSLGADALSNNTNNFNTAFGALALNLNDGGTNNTAIGNRAMRLNENGANNTALGYSAGINTLGSQNLALGTNSLLTNTTGSSNTAVGTSANVLSNNLTNATAIGANAAVGQSNSLVLGSIAGINGAASSTDVGIGTSTPSTELDIEGDNPRIRLKSTRSVASAAPQIDLGQDNGSGGFTLLGTIGVPGSSNHFRVSATNNLFFNTNLSTRMVLTSSGDLGIGTSTPNPGYFSGRVLHIAGVNNTGIILEKTDGPTSKWGLVTGIGGEFAVQNDVGGPGQNAFIMEQGVVSDQLYLQAGGNVGIGTPTPQALLEVSGFGGIARVSSTGGTSAFDEETPILEFNSRFGIDVQIRPSLGSMFIYGGNVETATVNLEYVFGFGGTFGPAFYSTSGVDLGQSGNRWGTVYATNGSINTSDKRLKKEIENIDYGLNDIMKLRSVSYQWKDNKYGTKTHLGLIAQEVQSIIPEVVNVGDDEEKYLGMAYTELLPVTIKAIQEQQQIIEDQETRIAELEKQLAKTNDEKASPKASAITPEQLKAMKAQIIEEVKAMLGAEAKKGEE